MDGHVMYAAQPTRQHDNGCERWLSVVLCGIVPFVGHGCAAFQRDLVGEGLIRLEEGPSDTARLSRVRVYEDKEDLVVYGKVGRKAGIKGRTEAIVRVLVRLPDGRTVEETKRAFPPYLPIRRSRKSNFTVRFDGLPPAGTVVRIECLPVPINAKALSSPAFVFHDKESRQ